MDASRCTLKPTVWMVATILLFTSVFAHSATSLTYDHARAIIMPFYEVMNRPTAENAEVLRRSTSPQWVGCSDGKSCLSRDQVVAHVRERGKAIPDFTWAIQDIIVSNNTVVVRGEATGTPVSSFMGLPVTGRSFRIMSVDIHVIENGKIARTHYIKDWASAARQLGGKQIAQTKSQ
jgi:predicted ester cyclase